MASKARPMLRSLVTSMTSPTARRRPARRLSSSAKASTARRSRSVTATDEPWSMSRWAMARPIPPAAPVTSPTSRASSASGGASESLYSSSGQYSTANASASETEV
jgi:hypothetical protein